MRILVFVPCYNVAKFLAKTLERVPSLDPLFSWNLLIVDDGSIDDTSLIAQSFLKNESYMKSRNISDIVLLSHKKNLGYGEVQKSAIDYAVEHKYDHAIMLHGDGQYAPEHLNRFSGELSKGADVVFGSRMGDIKGAFKGGMPVYKIIGNHILTTMQNFLLKSNLSEFHSGYRGYNVRWLETIPYRFNAHDFSFDTDLLIQAIMSKSKVIEFNIPTFYGEEECNVPGLKYAAKVIKVSLKARLYKLNFVLDRRFEGLLNEHYGSDQDTTELHQRASLMITNDTRILDIGCGAGGLLNILEKQRHCEALGIDKTPTTDPRIRCADIMSDKFEFSEEEKSVDGVTCLEVIEHLSDPEVFVEKLAAAYSTSPTKEFIFSTPNIAHWSIRLMLLFGVFSYGRRGILDKTHMRLFSRNSFLKLLKVHGFKVSTISPIGLPWEKILGNVILNKIFYKLEKIAMWIAPKVFAFQFVFKCGPPEKPENFREVFKKSKA